MKCRRAREAGWELVMRGTARTIRATYGVKEPYTQCCTRSRVPEGIEQRNEEPVRQSGIFDRKPE
jgi:hypothetical protein